MSNLSIPVVLSLIKDRTDYIVISEQEAIIDFFKYVVPEEKLLLLHKPPIFKKSKNLLAPFLLKKYKKSLLNAVPKLDNGNIFIFYNAFCTNITWLLKKRAESNKIIYAPDINVAFMKIKYSIKTCYLFLWNFFCYGVFIKPLWNGTNILPQLSSCDLNKMHAKIEKLTRDDEFISETIKDKFNIIFQARRIVWLGGDVVSNSVIEEGEYIQKTDCLIDEIGLTNMVFKGHPRYLEIYSREESLEKLPSMIPANVLSSLFDFFIGYSSSTLFEVANQGKVAISLVDFYEPLNIKYRISMKKYLIDNLKGNSIIFFPKNLKELKELL